VRRVLIALVTSSLLISAQPVSALHTLEKYVNASQLSKPGLLILNPDGTVLAENEPDSLRAPASVLKLLSMAVVLTNLDSSSRYVTTVWGTGKKREFLIRGSLDPYLSVNRSVSDKYGHGYLMGLLSRAGVLEYRKVLINYTGLYPGDVKGLKVAFKQRGIRATLKKVNGIKAKEIGVEELATLTSKPLSKMVSHVILWSDNAVADRLAKAVTRQLGNPSNAKGLTKTFKSELAKLNINTNGLVVKDGSGLSRENRISARTVVELLRVIRNDPRYAAIYEGLPISGKTGTLVKRFEKAPAAIDHVHAKTGWINRSVTMAGYVESGNQEYAFAILADGITPNLRSRNAARRTMDKLLEVVVKGSHQTP
jgi:D-alanyl-D-alanine carboxypeptidase/D-alanyl-D-alanine-endopeptidase (penicillin-binding protein 4)